MRIRILKTLTGIIDGHGLSQYHPGDVYDVSESFGRQLIEMNAAIEVRSTNPTAATYDEVDAGRLTGGVRVVPPDTADDRRERRSTADRRRTTRTDRRK